MLDALLKTLHVQAIVVWVGGMVFAHGCLRPAVAALEPHRRLKLMHDVLGRFFTLVLVAAPVVLVTGLAMVMHAAMAAAHAGGRFSRAVAAATWPAAGAAMNPIRQWVTLNLWLGLFIVVVVMLL